MGRLQYQVEYQRFPLWDVERLDQNRDAICEKSPNTWHEEHEEAGNDPGGLGGGALAKLGDNEQGRCVAGDRGLECYSKQVQRGTELCRELECWRASSKRSRTRELECWQAS